MIGGGPKDPRAVREEIQAIRTHLLTRMARILRAAASAACRGEGVAGLGSG
jgi:hypothetical protein